MTKWATFIFLIVLLVTSCQKKDEAVPFDIFNYSLTKTLMSAKSLDVFSTSKTIGIPLLILEGESVDLKKSVQKKCCLFFQRPFKGVQGKLWLSFVNLNEECALNTDALLTEGVDDLNVELQGPTKNSYLLLKSKMGNSEQLLKIPLVNLKNRPPYKYAEQEKITGFSPLLKIVHDNSSLFKIGKEDDAYSKKNAKRCFQVNENCETVGENLCEFCRYGWFEVVDYACPQGGSRFCGENKCGEKGEPACPSGKKVFSLEGVNLCFDDSEAGFCQGDLRPVCNEENILICR